jgi:hypothetical protein
VLQHEHEQGGAEESERDEQGDRGGRRKRTQTQRSRNRLLEIIDPSLKHCPASI